MNEIEQNSLAAKLLRMLRSWIDEIIPEQTRECIRSKSAIIVDRDETLERTIYVYENNVEVAKQIRIYKSGTYNVILSQNLTEYNEIAKKYDIDLTQSISQRRAMAHYPDFLRDIADISIENISPLVEGTTFQIDDYVIVGYLDNKLTNAFILCKNRS